MAEVFVILALLYGFTLQVAWRYDVSEHPHFMAVYRVLFPMLFPVFYAFLAASFFFDTCQSILLTIAACRCPQSVDGWRRSIIECRMFIILCFPLMPDQRTRRERATHSD